MTLAFEFLRAWFAVEVIGRLRRRRLPDLSRSGVTVDVRVRIVSLAGRQFDVVAETNSVCGKWVEITETRSGVDSYRAAARHLRRIAVAFEQRIGG